MSKNATRKQARYGITPRVTPTTRLHSGQAGNGHPVTLTDPTERGTRAARRETPYRVIGSTAGSYTTRVAGNTTRIYREER